jgi:hypothetical protein
MEVIMKTKLTIIISCVLVVGIILSGLAFADGQGKGNRQGFGFKQRHKGDGLMLLAKYERKNLMVQVLSELSKQSTETISTKLKEQRMHTVMQELGIDREVFRTAMRIKAIELIQKSAESGTITPEQAKDILAKMENRSKRRELMSQLIEKGIADGTITQEDAQMLLHKRR